MGIWFGCALPERFGDSATEYRYARETVALVDKNYRAFLYFTGPDRVRYLNAVLTNNVRDLAAGQGNASLLLNPQGRILAEVETYALEDRLLVVSYAMIRELLVTTLDKFIIMDDVTLDDATDTLAALALEGPATPALVSKLCGLDLDSLGELGHAEAAVAAIPCRVVRRSPGGVPGVEFICARGNVGTLWQALSEAVRAQRGGPIGYATLNILRLEAGIPWFGYDFDDKVIPHEAALEETHISFTKGCYTGQEIVERVRSRGHVNRRRVGLLFSGTSVPAAGEKLFAAGQEAGHVTRASVSPALGRAIGMGYVRREHNSLGSRLEWAGGTAEVIDLPIAAARAGRSGP